MSEQMVWMYKVQVTGGPTVTSSASLSFETYVKSSITVPKDNGTADVGFVSTPSLLVVSAPPIDPMGVKVVTYTINNEAADKKKSLDGPLVLIGKENVKLLNAALSKLTFTNPFAEDITIDVLSGNPS